ncbi:xanthine dehydrogenase family protein molybdopterin-binding subunit [Nocardioides daejeonensis]|uniref:xanthine dehydrogenase family protein molybdopterin-binding subunit n=1 Tax=Nocardioides daejeonensis TaxID=1046556 RepID=UPI000D747229|nr:xanthine dehydrogenase family protein molybdopterin-binding subunit [Nocardioides daejeonensis]
MIGESLQRVEDPVLLRGQGRFAADVTLPGQLHMRVVRSPVAHGRIRSIDTSAARALPGVAAVWTHDDIADLPPIAFRLTPIESMLPYRQPVLARGRVRYVGEPVAVVFAESEYLAEDAAELVDVEVEALPATVDPTGEPTPWLDAEEVAWTAVEAADGAGRDNESATIHLEYGDPDAAFAAAAHVFDVDVRVGRHSGVPMECRGGSAHVDAATGVLMVNGAAKVPFWNRDAIAQMVGRSPHEVQLIEGHVGGGFGPRGELYPEDVLVPLATIRLGRPVRWVEDRQEHLTTCNHSRDQRHRLRAAVDETGLITALDGEFWADQGAYVRTHGATVAGLTASMLPGPYLLPSYRITGHVRMSNKTPAGTYRSPGRYEGTFARERLIDAIANGLGLDRIELRRRNFIPADAMPYRRPILAMGTELVYDSGDYALLMDRMEETFDLPTLREEVAARREAGELVGIGYGWFVEKSGLGPSEGARVMVDTGGSALVTTGASSVGQGVDTVLSQVVGEVLDLDLDRIRTVRGQTEHFNYGRGAFATRQSVMVGNAVLESALAVRAKALRVAAHHLEIDEADLELVRGRVQVVGTPGTGLGLGEIAALLEPHRAKAIGEEPGLTCDGWFHSDHMTYPYGVHVAVVQIDRGTGKPTLERFLVGYDVGKALNHLLVEGQITGGAAQGIGGALYEEFRYAEDGQPQATTFMDYLMPTMAEMPEFGVLVTEDAPSPLNPLGVKGAGEGGTTATAAAIASAVDDALSRPGSVTQTPIRPDLIRQLISEPGHEQSPNQKEH